MSIGIGLLVAITFIAGFGWGQWWTERSIRAERASLDQGRMTVSMPMNLGDAEATLGLLKDLVHKAKEANHD